MVKGQTGQKLAMDERFDERDWVEFEAVVEHKTEKAMLIKPVNTDVQEWCPISQMFDKEPPKEFDDDGVGVFVVKRWWAEKYNIE